MADISDDDVIHTMTKLNLEADDKILFRSVRYFLKHAMPECCIAFQLRLVEPFPHTPGGFFDGFDDDKGLLGRLAHAEYERMMYWTWTDDVRQERGFDRLNYTPCPACTLAGRFIVLPEGCPCCADEGVHPNPSEE